MKPNGSEDSCLARLGEFDWLVYDEEKKLMHCKVCRSLPERAEKKDNFFFR